MRLLRSLFILLFTACFSFQSAWSNEPISSCEELLEKAPLSKVEEIRLLRTQVLSRLGFWQKDPFMRSTSLDQMTQVWARLHRAFPSLPELNTASYHAIQDDTPLEDSYVDRILKEIVLVKEDPDASVEKLQATVFTLSKLERTLEFFIEPEPLDTKEEEEEEENESGEEEKSEEKEEEEDKPSPPPSPPEYPDLEDEYTAHNKDTDNESGGGGARALLASVDQSGVTYFKLVTYNLVNVRTNKWSSIPIHAATPDSSQGNATRQLTIFSEMAKGKSFPLFLPSGFLPETFDRGGTRVWRDEKGNYRFITEHDQFEVPLKKMADASRPLTPAEVEAYTSPTGSKTQDWPETLQAQIEAAQFLREKHQNEKKGRYYGVKGDAHLAEDLARFIAREFKYRVDKDAAHSNIIEMAKKGAFQCDGATTLLIAILRDSFQIPCRAVGGFQGYADARRPGTSNVVTPSTGHAWVEVPDQKGNWWGVDPTPIEKDRETDSDGDSPEDDFSAISNSESDPSDSDESSDSQESSQTPQPDSDSQQKSISDLVEEFEKAQAEKQKQREAEKQKSGQSSGDQNGTEQDAQSSSDQEEGQEDGDLNDEVSKNSEIDDEGQTLLDGLSSLPNEALVQLYKKLIGWAIHPELPSKEKIERIHQLKSIVSSDMMIRNSLLPILSQLTTRFSEKKGPPFSDWLRTLIQNAPKKPLNDTVSQLIHIKRQLEITLSFIFPSEKKYWAGVVREIDRLMRNLNKYNDPDARSIQIAREMMENLPGNISRKLLREQHGISQDLGSDPATFSLSQAIVKGRHNNERLSAILGPHTDFVTDPIQRSAWSTRRTWIPTQDPRVRRRSLLNTRDPRLRKLFMNLYPDLSEKEALRRGLMYALQRRQEIRIPEGHEDLDPEKATILTFDVSGSMNGDPAHFQSMYISALTDRALSDLNPSGKARHKVYAFPFGDSPGDVEKIESPQQAFAYLSDILKKTRNRGQGTNIQSALLRALEIIQIANETGDKALARANIVLMTDGEAEVDLNQIRDKIKEIQKDQKIKTEIQFTFVAINSSNPLLVELAEESEKAGAQKGNYIEWNSGDIDKAIKASKAPAEPVNSFWSQVHWNSLDSDVKSQADRIVRSLQNNRASSLDRQYQQASRLLNEIEGKIGRARRRPESRANTLAFRLRNFRRHLKMIGTQMNLTARTRFIADFFQSWNEFFPGRKLDQDLEEFDLGELAHLHYIFEWVKSGQATGSE